MNRLALRMLFGDRARYLMLISGITFATVLMTQGAALFAGLMSWTFAPLRNTRAPVWVADPLVEQVNDQQPLRDIELSRVRSVPGVAWAVPLYQANTQARLPSGASKLVTLVGLDSATWIGSPEELLSGAWEDLRRPGAVIVDDYGAQSLGAPAGRPLRPGDRFEINDREARVVGVCRARRSFTGGPFIYTAYERATADYTPARRRVLSFVLAGPAPGLSAAALADRIRAATGLGAFSADDFMWSTVGWYVRNTGIPYNVGMIVVIGFFIGAIISGQAFYGFVLENRLHLAALKAMGAGTFTLCRMLLLQAFVVGLIGYGIGLGIVALIGRAALGVGKVPFLLLWQIPAGTLAAVLLISTLAAVAGIVRVARLEPAAVFRA